MFNSFFFSQNDPYVLLQQFTNPFLRNSIIIILILQKLCIPRSYNYPVAINETPGFGIKLHQFTNVEGYSDGKVCFDNAEYMVH